MNPDTKESLKTIAEEASAIADFIEGLDFDAYVNDKKTRFAVERGFEIIGEALNRLNKTDPAILNSIEHYRSIISFRNILAHAYDHIEDRIVWGIIETDLPRLTKNTKKLLRIE